MNNPQKILDNLRRQCSRREYCSSDVLKKAERALDGNKEEAMKILDTLRNEKYVDDFRYASAYAREKSSISGWGTVKINYMLSAKNVPRDAISAALDEIDGQKADARLRKLIENKYRTIKEDPQWKLKLLRFALGRGYSYDEVNVILNSMKEGH